MQVLALVAAPALAAASAAGTLTATVASDGNYSVFLNGAEWFASAPAFATAGGTVYSGSALKLASISKSTGSDALGAYVGKLL